MEIFLLILETILIIAVIILICLTTKLINQKEKILQNLLEQEYEYSGKLEEEIEFLKESNQKLAEENLHMYCDEEIEDVRGIKGKH